MSQTTAAHRAPPYIVVEGPIGVGKTSLARRLATSFNAALVLEQAEENPFLERFYRNPRAAALPAQLFFLFQRAKQLEALHQQDLFAATHVSDYLFDKDRLFARINLDVDELDLYEQVYARLSLEVPTPDLVIYLQAPIDVLLERIARRGIHYEQHIDRTYLEMLNNAYAGFFYDYRAAPLLIVNAAQADFVGRDQDYQQLLAELARVKPGRQYFNPAY
ncbi:MAG: deoxynucleoside kinase [Steroidobacteraceae bacterium]